MIYSGKNAASLLPVLFFKVRQLYTVLARVYLKGEGWSLYNWVRQQKTLYLFCQDYIYIALLEGRQPVLIDYEHTLRSFGKQNCSRKYASVNKLLHFMITQPIPEPFKAELMLWLHLAQPHIVSSWLSKRGKKKKKIWNYETTKRNKPKDINSALGLSAESHCSHHSWQNYTAAFVFLAATINFPLQAGKGHYSLCPVVQTLWNSR